MDPIAREELTELVRSVVREEMEARELTVEQAAESLGVPPSTIRKLLEEGTIASRTVDGQPLIAVSELHRLFSS